MKAGKAEILHWLRRLEAFVGTAPLSDTALADIARRVGGVASRATKCLYCEGPLWKSRKQKFCCPKCAEHWHNGRPRGAGR